MCKYKNMFKAYGLSESGRDLFPVAEVTSHINWAKTVLQKDDKIIWYLRIYRFLVLKENTPTYDKSMKMVDRWESVASAFFDCCSSLTLNEKCTTLEHYMALELDGIEGYVFGDKSMTVVFDALEAVEAKWKVKQERKSRSLEEYGTPFMTVGNYTWFNLERSGCHLEGGVMAHCGNNSGKRGDVVYSLREKADEPGSWIPHVTLILKVQESKWDAAGATTEIKGRFNAKPDVEFHDALIAFILSDRVIEMHDGGYLAQNNFKLADLSVEKQIELKKVKPTLFSVVEHLKDADGKVTPELTQSINKHGDIIRTDFIRLIDSKNIYEFANEWDMNRLLSYRNVFSGEYDELEDEELTSIRNQLIEHFQGMFKYLPYKVQVSLFFEDSAFSLYISKVDFLNFIVQIPEEERALSHIVDDNIAFEALTSIVATDLITRADKNDLLDSCDHILNSTDLFVLNKGKITAKCYNDVVNNYHKVQITSKFGPCQPYVEVFDGDLKDLADAFGMETLGNFSGTLDEGMDIHCEHVFDLDMVESQVKDVWENKLSADEKHHVQSMLMDAEFIDSDDYQVDASGCLLVDSFITLLAEHIDNKDSELEEGIKRAHRYADEAGSYDEMYEAALSSLDDLALNLESTIVRDGFESIQVNMSLSNYLDLTRQYIENSIGLEYFNIEFESFDDAMDMATDDLGELTSENIDMSEPYYGFAGFCDETALYQVKEAFDEFIRATKLAVAA